MCNTLFYMSVNILQCFFVDNIDCMCQNIEKRQSKLE
jgi:hypothetical protein